MCSYCGCDSIEVIGRFMSEHVEIINVTGELRAAVRSGEVGRLASARAAVSDLLWPHTVAEEAGLFRVMARDEVYADHIATLCGEHEILAVLLSELTPGDGAAMARFEDALRDHIDKEDNGLFPAAAIALDGPDWIEVHDTTPHAHDGSEPHVHSHDDVHAHSASEADHSPGTIGPTLCTARQG
ncbi:MAG: hemerythrin [Actinobacteria bacterium HGW-Actinobacteria-5]|jgi:hemerythrin-like domain-containing protein|nr:MAG: hemerythrin [Actinobacteria bacterium HGW-Actinobacteria-5]